MHATQELCSHAQQNKEHSRTLLRVLEAVVAEFNPEAAACSGLTWSQHEQCRATFEDSCLRQIFEAGVAVAMGASSEQDTLVVAGAIPRVFSCPQVHYSCHSSECGLGGWRKLAFFGLMGCCSISCDLGVQEHCCFSQPRSEFQKNRLQRRGARNLTASTVSEWHNCAVGNILSSKVNVANCPLNPAIYCMNGVAASGYVYMQMQ